MNAFWLKLIAIIGMTGNHIAHAFGDRVQPDIVYLLIYGMGGFTFPIMAFLMIEGFKKTRNVKRYMLRLLGAGILAAYPFVMAMGYVVANVMFTLLLGLLTMYLRDRIKNDRRYYLAVAGLVALSFFCDWNGIGVAIIFVLSDNSKLPESRRIWIVGAMFAVIAAFGAVPAFTASAMAGEGIWIRGFADCLFFISAIAAICLTRLYNGERGPGGVLAKYFFYAYYPAHLLVLGLLN